MLLEEEVIQLQTEILTPAPHQEAQGEQGEQVVELLQFLLKQLSVLVK